MNMTRSFSALDARIGLYGAVCAAGFAIILAILFARGQWITDANGTPILADFVPVYLAGREALHGNAAAVYDAVSFSRIQAAIIPAAQGWYPWPYPPTMFLVLAPLALVPYAVAFVGWEAATLALFALAVRAIVGRWSAVALMLASPLTWFNLYVGQNAFLSGALLAAALIWLERQPVLAGIALGVLTFKPQFGLLFPLVLVATGQWRAIAAAVITAAILAGAATAAFGGAVWAPFLGAMTTHGHSTFTAGDVAWDKIQTIYGAMRAAGAGAALAWAAQIAVSLAVTVVACRFWRQPAPFVLKAAVLAAGALIVTPYAFTYDLAAIAVPMAFLARDRIERGPVAGETIGAGAIIAGLFLVSPATPMLGSLPIGAAMLLGLIWLALRRRDVPAAAR
jgi:hypothetical protein